MCFGLFRKRKDYIKNSKKYIEKKFNFLSENGYEYDYFFCNGEETFSFCNNVVAFEIYHDIYPFAFDIVLRDGAVSFEETFDLCINASINPWLSFSYSTGNSLYSVIN